MEKKEEAARLSQAEAVQTCWLVEGYVGKSRQGLPLADPILQTRRKANELPVHVSFLGRQVVAPLFKQPTKALRMQPNEKYNRNYTPIADDIVPFNQLQNGLSSNKPSNSACMCLRL